MYEIDDVVDAEDGVGRQEGTENMTAQGDSEEHTAGQ